MPCYRCGARQIDPARGASPWKRGVRHETQVLVCPDCQQSHTGDLDSCRACGSTALICRLGEVECRGCGAVRPAQAPDQLVTSGAPPGLSAEVEAALSRVLGRAAAPRPGD
ncbi:hypothetical protein SAMN05421505_103262 [Sinosporangium album]|uniref:Uncharacterized protein n=1 Tax=Sinosporangium album TaxID=504805 RepID=A0A1G7TG42_9ACTN|nr:hypothetical protein [Sinosporangium album]SDG34205.1 hypothetical protein SAMN05421505_103262 [Sinosporangium album]